VSGVRFIVRSAGAEHLVLDRAYSHRPVQRFHLGGGSAEATKESADKLAAELNEKHGPWPC
jgi:hypothetical protein